MLPSIEVCEKCRYYKPWCKADYRSGGSVPLWERFSSYKYKDWWIILKLFKFILCGFLFFFLYLSIASQVWSIGIASGFLLLVICIWHYGCFYVPACVPWEASATERYMMD